MHHNVLVPTLWTKKYGSGEQDNASCKMEADFAFKKKYGGRKYFFATLHIYVSKLITRNFGEILIEIWTFSFKKIHLKMSSGKWCPFCLCLNVLSVDLERKYFVVIAYLSTCMFTICGRSSPSPSKTAKNKANAEEWATPPKERTSPLKERNSPPKESLIQSPQAAITEVTIKDYEDNWQKEVEVIMIYWCHFF